MDRRITQADVDRYNARRFSDVVVIDEDLQIAVRYDRATGVKLATAALETGLWLAAPERRALAGRDDG